MRIVASQVEAQSQHLFKRSERQLQMRAEGGPAATRPAVSAPPPTPGPAVPTTSLPALAVALPTAGAIAAPADSSEGIAPGDQLSLGVSLLKALVEAMTGRRIETASFHGSASATTSFNVATTTGGSGATTVTALAISEYEYLDIGFSAQLQTDDGSRLSIDLRFTMERSFQFVGISARSSAPTDPLLLNFDGLGARLDGTTFQFDLNGDGAVSTLAALAPGSAWLALDRNGNGRIDDGTELFGPNSGDGFAELAQYDDDGNGFIDSGDAIFAQLRLFRPGGALETLAQRGVGAIFLGAIDSPFRFTDGADVTLAQLRATSFYVSQNGAGLVQQLDLSA